MIEPCRVVAMTGEHVAAVAGLCRALGYEAPDDRVRERFGLLQRQAGHGVLVAVAGDGQAVGFLHVFARPMLEDVPAAQIQAMAVHEAWRGKGVGGALLAAGEAWAGARGLARMVVYSAEGRADAHAFYGRCGFRSAGASQRFVKPLGP